MPMPSYPSAWLKENARAGAKCLTGSSGGAPAVPETAQFTILLAEDDAVIRSLVGEVLRHHGYPVLAAADGRAALELSARYPGPIHLLLTDLSMPRLCGQELHRRIGVERPGIATLFMSGESDPSLHQGARLLRKPFAPAALLREVREALTAQVAVNPLLRVRRHQPESREEDGRGRV
jgi:CheY-like chemotaxis protein